MQNYGSFAGGEISNVNDVVGGFTIANGVVIENAIGSDYADIFRVIVYQQTQRRRDDLIYGGGHQLLVTQPIFLFVRTTSIPTASHSR